MFQSLDLFRLSGAMARHAGQRIAVTADNIANADTPGFRARRLDGFAAALAGRAPLTATRPGHLGAGPGTEPRTRATTVEAAPNGNAVSLEEEMLQAVEATREHARALAIYRHGMNVLRSSLGR